MTATTADTHLRRTLREVALVLGGVFAEYSADDEMVACIGRCLGETFRDALGRRGRPPRRTRSLHRDIEELVGLTSADLDGDRPSPPRAGEEV